LELTEREQAKREPAERELTIRKVVLAVEWP